MKVNDIEKTAVSVKASTPIEMDFETDNILQSEGSQSRVTEKSESDSSIIDLDNDVDDDDVQLVENELRGEPKCKVRKGESNSKTAQPVGNIYIPLVCLNSDKNIKKVVFDNNGVKVMIDLTEHRPRDDISLYVVSITSDNEKPIYDINFQPVVPKDCRLKVQPPSCTELPGYIPNTSYTTVVQIMLISATHEECIPLKFVVSYKIDGETITEMGEVPSLPLVTN